MGMNGNSSNSLKDGLQMFDNALDMVWGGKEGTEVDYSGNYREESRMMELDAEAQAAEVGRQAKKEARQLRSSQEIERSRQNTEWGRSGLAMSGSKQLVRDAKQQEDLQAEEDVLFEGEIKEKDVLDKGLRDANRYRIRRGLEPSTLTLGSSIYKYGK